MGTESNTDHVIDEPGMDDQRPEISQKLVRLGPFGDLIEANLYRVKMEDAGLMVELAGENQAAALGPIYGRAYGGVHLLVRESQADAARQIVAEVEENRRERLSKENPPCPRCHDYRVNRVIGLDRWLGVGLILFCSLAFGIPGFGPILGLALLLAGAFLIGRTTLPKWFCTRCGQRYRASKPDMLSD